MNRESVLKLNRKRWLIILLMIVIVLILFILNIFFGTSLLSINEVIDALLNKGDSSSIRIIYNIRLPRVIGALLSGALLSLSGLIMQTSLSNDLVSPSTLGVSNASVFGANLSILFFSGYLTTGNNINIYLSNINLYSTSLFAFFFSLINIVIILVLSNIKRFSPVSLCLSGIALGYIFSSLTTLLQYFASDVGLSAAIIWNFGDLSRATYKVDLVLFIVFIISFIFFMLNSYKYNLLINGDESAMSYGVNTRLIRIISLFISSILVSLVVSFFGIIGFIGLICPQISKKIIGSNHVYLIPSTILSGSILLLLADLLSRTIGNGSSLPAGALTSLIGAPFFLSLILLRKKND